MRYIFILIGLIAALSGTAFSGENVHSVKADSDTVKLHTRGGETIEAKSLEQYILFDSDVAFVDLINITTVSLNRMDISVLGNIAVGSSTFTVNPPGTGSTAFSIEFTDIPVPVISDTFSGTCYRNGNPADNNAFYQITGQTRMRASLSLTSSSSSLWVCDFTFRTK